MMHAVRIVLIVAVAAIALLMLGSAALWLFAPSSAAASIRMPLLAGDALSSQMDIGAFFFGAGAFALLGLITRKAEWFIAAAILVLGAAALRTMAFAFHGASLLADFIVLEVVMGAVLIAASRILARPLQSVERP